MENHRTKKVLQLALEAGVVQLSNGAEVWRVEATLNYICAAFGVKDVDVIVLSNAIFLTGNNENDDVYAKVKHIPLSGVHMGIVTAVNHLSREISMGEYTVDEAVEKLEQIKQMKPKNKWYRAVASAIGAACFIFILGANAVESIIAGVLGGMVFMLSYVLDKFELSKLIKISFVVHL